MQTTYQVKHVTAADGVALASAVHDALDAIPLGGVISVHFVSATEAFIVYKG